jgi:hypothetical protein
LGPPEPRNTRNCGGGTRQEGVEALKLRPPTRALRRRHAPRTLSKVSVHISPGAKKWRRRLGLRTRRPSPGRQASQRILTFSVTASPDRSHSNATSRVQLLVFASLNARRKSYVGPAAMRENRTNHATDDRALLNSNLRMLWRSGRDSNPRYGFAVYSLSRRAPSTTRPPLHPHPYGCLPQEPPPTGA